MKRAILTVVTSSLICAVSFAGEIQQRKENQQQRIGQGVENGSLTARETKHLEGREAALNREIRHDRKDGGLTEKDRAQINRQQNRISRSIYNQKHDGQHQ